jgi:hypothetical protein
MRLNIHDYLYKPRTLCELLIVPKYETGVLQTPTLKLLTSSSGPPHDLALLGDSDTICNDPGKIVCHIYTITLNGLINLEFP